MVRLSLAFALVCACSDDAARNVHVTSEVAGIDQLAITVLEPTGAIVNDRAVPQPPEPITLPARFALDDSGRTGTARLLVWGLAAGARVAFGVTPISLGDTTDVDVRLAPPPPDCDDDGIPD